MTSLRHLGHGVLLALLGVLAIFINGSSKEQPLRHYDDTLLSLLKTNHPYLLKGMDMSHQGIGIGSPWLPIRLEGHDLSGLDLRDVRLPSPHGLRHVSLRGAHLARADFSCVNLEDVALDGADLSQARFDFGPNNCKEHSAQTAQAKACAMRLIPSSPKPTKDRGDHSCTLLRIDLTGANLKRALLQGDRNQSSSPAAEACSHWLVIEGDMAGARFEEATLRCVVLRNRSQPAPTSILQRLGATTLHTREALAEQIDSFFQRVQWKDPAPSRPGENATLLKTPVLQLNSHPTSQSKDQRPAAETPHGYTGVGFQASRLDNVILEEGNFMFSDFWQAHLLKVFVVLSSDNSKTWVNSLGFTSIADLKCPQNGCQLWFSPVPDQDPWTAPASKLLPSRLSLNVRGSHIVSNLKPTEYKGTKVVLPVLLCNNQTKWSVSRTYSESSVSKESSADELVCSQLNGSMQLRRSASKP